MTASNFAILIPTHPNDGVKRLSLSQIISIPPSTLRFYFPGLKSIQRHLAQFTNYIDSRSGEARG